MLEDFDEGFSNFDVRQAFVWQRTEPILEIDKRVADAQALVSTHFEDGENAIVEKDLREVRSTYLLLEHWQEEKFSRGWLTTLVEDAILLRGDFHLIDELSDQLIGVRTGQVHIAVLRAATTVATPSFRFLLQVEIDVVENVTTAETIDGCGSMCSGVNVLFGI